VRHRAKLVALRSGLKAQVHAVLAKQGVRVPMSDLFGAAGRQLLDELRLDPPYHTRVASLRRLIDAVDSEIDTAGRQVSAQLSEDPGWRAVQTIDGIGPVLASVFVAEIGDVHRFARPEQLCSWAGLTPNMAATFLVGLVFAFQQREQAPRPEPVPVAGVPGDVRARHRRGQAGLADGDPGPAALAKAASGLWRPSLRSGSTPPSAPSPGSPNRPGAAAGIGPRSSSPPWRVPWRCFGSVWLLAVAQRRLNWPLRWPGLAASRSAYGAFILQSVVLIGLAMAVRPCRYRPRSRRSCWPRPVWRVPSASPGC
jgi:hypothetical protein